MREEIKNVKFATLESEVAKKRIALAKKVIGIFPRRDDLHQALVLDEEDLFIDSDFVGSYLLEMSEYEYYTPKERAELFKKGEEWKILAAAKEAVSCLEAYEEWEKIESKEVVEKEEQQQYEK